MNGLLRATACHAAFGEIALLTLMTSYSQVEVQEIESCYLLCQRKILPTSTPVSLIRPGWLSESLFKFNRRWR